MSADQEREHIPLPAHQHVGRLKEQDAHPLRIQIHHLVKLDAGVTKTELLRKLKVTPGTIHYHLGRMEKSRRIQSFVQGQNRHLFVHGLPRRVQRVIVQLRHPLRCSILQVLCEFGDSSSTQLAHALDVSTGALNRALSKLVRAGLVEKAGHYRPQYSVAQDSSLREMILDVLFARTADAGGRVQGPTTVVNRHRRLQVPR